MLLTSAVVAEPLDFSLPDLKGETQSLSDYRGKWVVVNFWATWCPPCLEEIPDLVMFHETHRDKDAVVLGVNFEDAGREQIKVFADDYLISYPVLLNPGLVPPVPSMTVGGLPTTYLISPEGELVARQEGPITAKAIEAYLEKKMQSRSAVSGKAVD